MKINRLLFFLIPLIALLVIVFAFVYSVIVVKKPAPPKRSNTQNIKMKALSITSSEFADRGRIPSKYTCDGEDVNPPLVFENVPEDAQSLTLIVEDPDAPGKTWVHWVVINIPPHTTQVHEDSVPNEAVEAVTDFGKTGYGGPCPPSGVHRYYFKLYALDAKLDVNEDITKEELEHSMDGHILDKAELIGLYSRE